MWTTSMNDTTKLTLELREIVDNVENPVDIWDFEYPSFYQGEEKKKFERKVIDHFYFRQIGQETVGRFLHMFRSRIVEIMPYYIQLYESEKYMQEIEDPFATVDYTETYEEESTGQSSGQSSSQSSGTDNRTTTGNNEHRMSNTPQGSIDNLDSYMTEASRDNASNTDNTETSGESSGNSSSQSSGTVKHTLTKKGAMGVTTFGHDMLEYRQTFLNIDMMIINNLQDLFLGVY